MTPMPRKARPASAATNAGSINDKLARQVALIALTPQGRPLTQAVVEELAALGREQGGGGDVHGHVPADAVEVLRRALEGVEPEIFACSAVTRKGRTELLAARDTLPVAARSVLHRLVARFDDGALVLPSYLPDRAHPGGDHEDAVGPRQSATGQPGARAACHEGHPVLRAGADDRGNLLGGLGHDHESRRDLVVRQAVALVGAQPRVVGDHAVGRQHPPGHRGHRGHGRRAPTSTPRR